MAVQVEVLVNMGRFPIQEVSYVLLGPGETRVFKKGMEALLLGTSV